MIKLKDLKVGDYVKSLYDNSIIIVDKINKKSFTTARGGTIYESEFKNYFVITEEEARANTIHRYNKELKELNKNLKELQENLNTTPLDNPYYILDVQAIEEEINDILEIIKEVLENE